jgi:hypothetical protein
MGLVAKCCYTCRRKMVCVGRKPSRYKCRNPECGKEQAARKARQAQRGSQRAGRAHGRASSA